MTKLPTGYNPDDLPGQIVDEGWGGRIVDPDTGAGLFTGNTNPQIVGIDPVTGTDAPLGTDMAFGAAIRRWMHAGVYNSDFAVPPADTEEAIDNDYNMLPYWNFVPTQSGCITAHTEADADTASGRVVRFDLHANGYQDDDAYIEQLVPVVGSASRKMSLFVSSAWRSHPSTLNAGIYPLGPDAYTDVRFLKADLTPTGEVMSDAGLWWSTIEGLDRSYARASESDSRRAMNCTIPANAYYARCRFGVRRWTAAPSSFGSIYLTDVAAFHASDALDVTDLMAEGWHPSYLQTTKGSPLIYQPSAPSTAGTATWTFTFQGLGDDEPTLDCLATADNHIGYSSFPIDYGHFETVQVGAGGPTITSGSGAPSASADDGSIYMRDDGGSGTTLYLRISGAWSAIA